MKIYQYAKQRNVKSKDVVKKLHEMGYTNVKNHLSLIPEKIIDELDDYNFNTNDTKKNKNKETKTIAYISMECAPFISKGLGDMVRNKVQQSSLAGNKNIVIIPKYNMDNSILTYLMDINVSVYHKNQQGKVYQTTYEDNDYYFIESESYFNRDQLYGFFDDAERFAFLAKAALEVIKYLNQPIDIINVHDWPLGLFPIIYQENLKEAFPDTKVEFSVYGSTYQGIYGVEVLTDVFELDKSYYDNHIVEYASSVNFLKSGLITADQLDINKVALNDLKNSYLKEFIYDNR